MAAVPVLEAVEARVDVDGVTALDGLTLSTGGDHVVVAGDARALFAVLTGVPMGGLGDGDEASGEAELVAGTLALAGRSVAERAHVEAMGAAPLDPPAPPGWTAEDYVAWGARLAGVKRGDANELAAAGLSRLGLGAVRCKKLGALPLPERRAVMLAQAVVSGPEVLVAEAPLSGIEGPAAGLVMQALLAATEGRRALVSVARLDAAGAEGALARRASHLVVLAGGKVALEGPPEELFAAAQVLALRVRSNAEALRAELALRGMDLRGGPERFSVALPVGTSTKEVLAAAVASRATLVEMVPLLG